jgi:hypothetical protein
MRWDLTIRQLGALGVACAFVLALGACGKSDNEEKANEQAAPPAAEKPAEAPPAATPAPAAEKPAEAAPAPAPAPAATPAPAPAPSGDSMQKDGGEMKQMKGPDDKSGDDQDPSPREEDE